MLEICAVCRYREKQVLLNYKQRYRCKNCNKNQAETDGRMKYSGEEWCIWRVADFEELRELWVKCLASNLPIEVGGYLFQFEFL